MKQRLTAAIIICCTLAVPCSDTGRAQDYRPPISEASREGELAVGSFTIPDGMTGELMAAEPLLANPVAFWISADGSVYVCETFRQEAGVEDNRGHMNWLENDLQLQTVEERLAMFRRYLGDDIGRYREHQDRIRLLRDTDGDGVFDSDTLFADGFNDALDGTGAGVIEHNGSVYYTCIPNLWKLTDSDGDGIAESHDLLHHGYGVRVAFRGHDMHGLTVGPDGRLYFSIGDRGYNVITREGTRLHRPDTGAVFRCDADGGNLEVFAYGLRNPQELAFDDAGNLFTGDNNSDGGDQARWVYVVQDGDTGWRMYYQYLEDRGPWNRERMWYPRDGNEETAAVQPAYIVPPIANLADGPSGLTYYPGIGLPERYRDHFFMADFRGASANSGIRSFSVRPDGAGFELTDSHKFLWTILPTDVDFDADGNLVVSDWVNGWVGEGKGRLYRFTHHESAEAAAAANSRQLLLGMSQAALSGLVSLLNHADRRVRQAAQFELVRRDEREAVRNAASAADPLVRRHGRRGLWQFGLESSSLAPEVVRDLLADRDDAGPEDREQAVRIIDDLVRRHGLEIVLPDALRGRVLTMLRENCRGDNARLAGFSAAALGRIGRASDRSLLLEKLASVADSDPILRFQLIAGLTELAGRVPGLLNGPPPESADARLAIVVAMRRRHDVSVARFLKDADPRVVLEAARAVNDEPIESAMRFLTQLELKPDAPDALNRRILNAVFRDGTSRSAARVAAVAASADFPESLRTKAVEMLRTWVSPGNLDTVTGMWRPLGPREVPRLGDAIESSLPAMLRADRSTKLAAVEIAGIHRIAEVTEQLNRLYAESAQDTELRAEIFRTLAVISEDPTELLDRGSRDPDEGIRLATADLLADRQPAKAIPLLAEFLQSGSVEARQKACSVLGRMTNDEAARVLETGLSLVREDNFPAGARLDLLEAAAGSSDALRAAVDAYRTELASSDDPLAAWSDCLEGGDPERGNTVFFGRAAASCRRCHKVDGNGADVGPDLSGIGREKDRRYLLEAIVHPDAKIAKGFETVILIDEDGRIHSGILREETEEHVKLVTPKGEVITVPADSIEERAVGKSGMPSDLSKNLSRFEIRDVVAYLVTLRKRVDTSHGEGE